MDHMKERHDILYTKERLIPVVQTHDAGMPAWCPFQGQCMMLRTIFGGSQRHITLLTENGAVAAVNLKVKDVRPAGKNFCMFCDDGILFHKSLNSCRDARKYNVANMTVVSMQRLTGGRPGVYDFVAVRYAAYIGHGENPKALSYKRNVH